MAISLKLLAFIKHAQSENGMRHDDFGRYRGFVTRRIQKLRKQLRFHHGKGKRYEGKSLETRALLFDDASQDLKPTAEPFLHMVVLESERAWAFAMEAKATMHEVHRRKYTVINKLKRALDFVGILERLCSQQPAPVDTASLLEIQAHLKFLEASLSLEKSNWRDALKAAISAKYLHYRLIVFRLSVLGSYTKS